MANTLKILSINFKGFGDKHYPLYDVKVSLDDRVWLLTMFSYVEEHGLLVRGVLQVDEFKDLVIQCGSTVGPANVARMLRMFQRGKKFTFPVDVPCV